MPSIMRATARRPPDDLSQIPVTKVALRTRDGLVTSIAIALIATLLPANPSSAAWRPNGTPIATSTDLEFSPFVVPDGQGGAFISWVRYSTTAGGVYALAIGADGEIRAGWPTDGLLLPELTGGSDPCMTEDGLGGAVVTATGPSFVGLRHLTPPGVSASTRTAFGVSRNAVPSTSEPLPVAATMHSGLVLSVVIPDGVGGAYVSFMDNQRFYDVGYVRHYAADGSFTQLSLSDLTGCGNFYCFLETPTLCPDGAGGVFVAWSQGCGARVLRLTPELTPAPGWPSTGVVAEDCPMSAGYVGICADGSGGAYVAWQGSPNGIDLQHLTGSGATAPGWADVTGLVLSHHPTLPGFLRPYGWAFCSIVPDQLGGALVAWTDGRADTGDVYVQRVRSDGSIAPGWAPEGVAVGMAPGMQENPVVAADGSGGAWIAWQDDLDSTIRANHVDASGANDLPSTPAGILVSGGPGPRFVPASRATALTGRSSPGSMIGMAMATSTPVTSPWTRP